MEKEELLQKVKDLANSEDLRNAYFEIKKFGRNFRDNDDESYYDQQLNDEYNKIVNDLAGKLGDIALDAKSKKEEIIAKAKEIANSGDFKKGTGKLKELMDEWKQSGRGNKDDDDTLWNEFNELRTAFFNKKQEYYDNLMKSFEENKTKKTEIIGKAKQALESEDIPSVNNVMKNLMDDWKKVGHAGKDNEDALWNEFSSLRKEFFKKRDNYYEAMKETYASRTLQKQEIIKEAKLYLARSEFTEDEMASMNALKDKWKEIGSAGRENENKLWDEFKTIVNKYNDNMKYYK